MSLFNDLKDEICILKQFLRQLEHENNLTQHLNIQENNYAANLKRMLETKLNFFTKKQEDKVKR